MKTIILTRETSSIHETLYVTIAKRWINIKGEHALLEGDEWDEYPLEDVANVRIGSLLYKKCDEDAIKAIVEREIFDSKISEKLRSFKLGY
jgi:hypothetical protein